MQPTFSPQKKIIAVGKKNPVLLMNLHSRSAQNCGIPGPTQDRNGITGTEDSQATCTQAGTTPSAAGTIVFYIYGPIFLPDLQPSDKGAEPSTEIQCKSLPGTKLTDVKK